MTLQLGSIGQRRTGNMRLIDRKLIDGVIATARTSPRKRQNYNFHQHSDALQRFLNAMEPGTYFCPHRHLQASKTETFVVLCGSIGIVQFTEEGRIVSTAIAKPGGDVFGVDLNPTDWHTLVVLEPGTVILECKAGPYIADTAKDFAPWAPKEGSAEAVEALRTWEQLFI